MNQIQKEASWRREMNQQSNGTFLLKGVLISAK